MAENRIDLIRPDAPELAAYGEYPVGVRTRSFTDPGRIDVLNVTAGAVPVYDRPLSVEIWYPAAPGTVPGTTYDTVTRDGRTPTRLAGRASRDAAPASGHCFPVVLISHGYPGNRLLMSHLGENLASKGYVAVSIDHTDSTYSDQGAFGSTLLHRPLDQRFVLDRIGDPDGLGPDLAAVTQADTAGLVGYSMGGYGALVYAGAGVTAQAVTFDRGTPNGLLAAHQAGTDSHAALARDPRLRAVIAVAPWGRQHGFWDAGGIAAIRRPLMLIAGGADDVSSYPAMRQIFDEMTGTCRHLLTFDHAGHNAAAPMPAPAESWQPVDTLDFVPFEHYADPVWDTTRMNNIFQHFATAFFDLHLKGDTGKAPYLDPAGGAQKGDDKDWPGFATRSAPGLRFETKRPGE